MDCEEAKLKVQALVDNELDETEIPDVIGHIESCYRCREEYISLLSLQRTLKGVKYPEPPEEWFIQRYRRPGRIFGSAVGTGFFIVSYIALIVFAFVTVFRDPEISSILRIILGGIASGVLVLLAVTIGDRIREKKDDRYGDVQK